MARTSNNYNKGYYMKDMLAWRTIYSLYTLALIACFLEQRVASQSSPYRRSGQSDKQNSPYSNNFQLDQFQSSGNDGVDFEDDDDESMSSGGGLVSPPINRPAQPGGVQPGGGRVSPPVSRPAQPGGAHPGQGGEREDDVFDNWKNPGRGDNNNNRFSPSPAHDDDDDNDIYEPSGDIILEPERKGEVPRQGGEVRVDPPTQPPLNVPWPTAPRRPDGPPFDRSTPADPWRPTTTKNLIVRPDGEGNTDSSGGDQSDSHSYKGTSAFFRIFNDPLVLAGIISGAVLALLCIVLIVMYMIYRMRKKDEGSYALGEPKRTYDIRYTRTKDQEFFA